MKVMDMKRITLISAVLVLCAAISAQEEYYRVVQGLRKAELKTALFELIQPQTVLSYGSKGEGYTWAGFVAADSMAGGQVRDRYSDNVRYFDGLNAVSGMNIEHVFANSWWGHTVNNAYCDLFNLFPSDETANGRKSNNPIGVVTATASFDNGVICVGKSDCYSEDSLITVWEPADNWKGDFARTHFYMATCYEDFADLWQTTEGLLLLEPNSYPTLRSWALDLLLEWNEADPPDSIETARNEVVYAIQGNRNPFVDYPQLADYVWGDSTDYAFYIHPDDTVAQLFVPQDGDTLDYGLQALTLGFADSIIIRGRNMNGTVRLSMDNGLMMISDTLLTEEQVTDGFVLGISCNPDTSGAYSGMLVIEGDGFEQRNVICIQFVDGIPAYEAQDIACYVNSKHFTASWMSMGDGVTYYLEVYTKSSSGTETMIDGYPITTTETEQQVSGLKASTTYYYRVSLLDDEGNISLTSNEVQVDMPAVTPVYSADVNELSFTTVPGRASSAQTVTVTALSVTEYKSTAVVTAPFEVSADGEEWNEEATITGSSQTLYVRLGSVEEEGEFESELILSSTGVDDIVISLSGKVDALKSFFETFETGSKNAYAESEVTCAAATWRMAQSLIGGLENDRKNDEKSVRMQVKSNVETALEMMEDKTDGCDTLSFYAGLFGSDTGVKLTVSYSLDGGLSWVPIVENLSFTNGEWMRYVYYLGVDGLIRLKFEASGSSSKRLNVDDIQMSDYVDNTDEEEEETSVATVHTADNDMVSVYTLGGVFVRTAPRSQALTGLKPAYYIIK